MVFDEKTDNILFEKNADRLSYPASLTKLMTLYLTFEALESGKIKENQVLKMSAYGAEISAVNKYSTFSAKEGFEVTVKKAIHAVIVKSFNEAAVILGEAVSGDEWHFSRAMNEKARQLGMINTSFRNASGLHHEGQYTTAYDLGRLTKAIKNDFPGYYHLFSMRNFEHNGLEYKTHNHVLEEYKGAEGMKTGFTNASGFNLISSAYKENHRVVSIILGCATYQGRDIVTKGLLDLAFEKLSKTKSESPAKLSLGFNYNNS
mgnify:CR=1 FL=1